MKNANQILSSLQNRPQFSKLSQYRCIQKIQELFPIHLQNMIQYGYFKNGVLNFVLSHPWAKQEFNVIIQSIKTPLKHVPPLECQELSITNIRAYVSFKPTKPEILFEGSSTKECYEERAQAEFQNSVTEPKLHNLIEEIRKIIDDTEH
jgi:hypothetical protein